MHNPMIYFNKSVFYLAHDLNRFQGLGHALRSLFAGDKHALGSTRPWAISWPICACSANISYHRFPELIRQVIHIDPEAWKPLKFLANNITLSALTICALYKQRWRVELFFKWIKQHLLIKNFFVTNANAVKTQIWTAFTNYVSIAIVQKRLKLGFFTKFCELWI